jgi:hypothetical protein
LKVDEDNYSNGEEFKSEGFRRVVRIKGVRRSQEKSREGREGILSMG